MTRNESLPDNNHVVRLCSEEQFEHERPLIISLLFTEDDKQNKDEKYLSCYWCEHIDLNFENFFLKNCEFNKKLFKDIPQGRGKKYKSHFMLMKIKNIKKIKECEDIRHMPLTKKEHGSKSESHSGIFGKFEEGKLKRHIQFLNSIIEIKHGTQMDLSET